MLKRHSGTLPLFERRLRLLLAGCVFFGLILFARFFQLQVLEHASYQTLASGQHGLERALYPKRGTIYVRDRVDGKLYPIATDRDAWQVFANPREMTDRASTFDRVASMLALDRGGVEEKFMASSTTYLVLHRDASYEQIEAIRTAKLRGIGVHKGRTRLYPEAGLGGQMLGFVAVNDANVRVGKYGLEGYFDEELRGKEGKLIAERDAAGRRLTIGSIQFEEAQDGKDFVLTIDRRMQFFVCAKAAEATKRFGAKASSIVVVDPKDGSLLAACSDPDFDPASFRKVEDIATFNNPITFTHYEPGSIFKPITLAAGIDAGKITPRSTYNDTGAETIDEFTIRNSDKKSHGVQTMTQVLEKSLNTGTIYVERLLGKDLFRSYIEKFGFGERTGVPLSAEGKGDISQIYKKGEIFGATASFGQGIATTPLQMAMAFVPLANGGLRFAPRLIEGYRRSDGSVERLPPKVVERVIEENTSRLISAMMVNVVENGHGKRAGVPGYYVAGKTGTAQIPNPNGPGYLKDATIGSFVGYAPAEEPKFVIFVKIDRPTTVEFAESSAAPIFGEVAKELISLMHIPPERKIVVPKPPQPPLAASSTTP